MIIIIPKQRKHSFKPIVVSENDTEIFLSDEYDPPMFLPRVPVKKGEKWIKHVYLEGIREHVLRWGGRLDFQGKIVAFKRCSEKDCIVNKPFAK